MDDDTVSQSLLQSVFARKRSQSLAKPASLRSRNRETLLQTDAFLQHDDLGEGDPESVARTLLPFEHLVLDDSDREIDSSFQQPRHKQYPKIRPMTENPTRDPHADQGTVIRVGKRRREGDDASRELLHLEQERKKRRVLHREEPPFAEQSFQQPGHEQHPKIRPMTENPTRDPHADQGTVIRERKKRRVLHHEEPTHGSNLEDPDVEHLEQERKKRRVLHHEEPTHGSNLEDPDVDFAMLMRKYLVSLDNALRRHWVCVCQKCSGLSVRLSLPQHKKDLEAEASFEVFFGVRSIPATALQEAKITVK
ncbi:hypothetical protein LTR41_008396 [Exophiala xenobiotica]|nr:hypothetical protein LTR41_008396 [Exophiala xenobiotica]